MSGVWIGIDLGTSNSACAIWDSSRGSPKWIRLPKIALTESSGTKLGRMVPSVVKIQGDESFWVGAQALQQQQQQEGENFSSSGTIVSSIKRLFGKEFQDLDSKLLEALPFHVENNEDDDGRKTVQLVVPVTTSDNSVLVVQTNPVEIVSILLKAIREAAQQYLNKYQAKKHLQVPGEGIIRNVVVGVPAHYSKRHMSLLESACRQAGFDGHVSTCLESTAAAMAYGLSMQEKSRTANIMVIDMGGGTTDITIATKQNSNNKVEELPEGNVSSYKVLVTQGDENLGGDDIDQALMSYFCQQKITIPVKDSMGLLKACRKAKEALCDLESNSTSETISFEEQEVTISQDQFNILLTPWLDKAKHLIKTATNKFLSLEKGQVSEVILVGGTTKTPAIRKMIQSLFPSLELCTSLNPMSSVAQGLAIQAAIQSKLVPIHQLKSALMLDCVPHAIGVELPNGTFRELIPRNMPLPARGFATFELADKYQQGVSIRAVEHVGSNKLEPMSRDDFTFLLRRLSADILDGLKTRTIQIGMKVDTRGQFTVSMFDENDPEQVRKRERFEKISASGKAPDEVVGELGYIKELILDESNSSVEQFLLFGILMGVVVLYVAVKLAFHEPELNI